MKECSIVTQAPYCRFYESCIAFIPRYTVAQTSSDWLSQGVGYAEVEYKHGSIVYIYMFKFQQIIFLDSGDLNMSMKVNPQLCFSIRRTILYKSK